MQMPCRMVAPAVIDPQAFLDAFFFYVFRPDLEPLFHGPARLRGDEGHDFAAGFAVPDIQFTYLIFCVGAVANLLKILQQNGKNLADSQTGGRES